MNASSKRKLRFLAGFAVYFGALWLLWDTPLVYPLKIFVVLLHEVSHAVAAVATGGAVSHIELDPNQGGATYTLGGNAFLTLSAGYLGSLGWGALMVEAARAKRIRTDFVNGVVGAMVVILTLSVIRGGFGLAFGSLFGVALMVLARKASVEMNRSVLMTLGMTSSLYAILDIKSDVLDRPHLESDAHMLADLTGVPTPVWGFLWIGIALGVTFLLFRRAYRQA